MTNLINTISIAKTQLNEKNILSLSTIPPFCVFFTWIRILLNDADAHRFVAGDALAAPPASV